MSRYLIWVVLISILFIGVIFSMITFGSSSNSEKSKQNIKMNQESIKDSVGIVNFIKSTGSNVFDSVVSTSYLSYQQDTNVSKYMLEGEIKDIYISGSDTVAIFKVNNTLATYWFDVTITSDQISKLDIESSNIIAISAKYTGQTICSASKENRFLTLREFKYSGKLIDVYVK